MMDDDDEDEEWKDQPNIQINFNTQIKPKIAGSKLTLRTQTRSTPQDSFYDSSFYEDRHSGPFKYVEPSTTKMTPKSKGYKTNFAMQSAPKQIKNNT